MLTLTHGNVLMMRREQYLVCVFVLSLTEVSVSAGVQLSANVLTVRYQSVKGVASMGIYRSCSSARYRRLTAQSTRFGVFVSCL